MKRKSANADGARNSRKRRIFALASGAVLSLVAVASATVWFMHATTRADYIQQGNLVGYWPLNETSGSTAADVSGYGRNATYNNSPTPIASAPATSFPDSYSLGFNGTNQFVDAGSQSSLYSSNYTFSAWVYPTAYTNGASRIAQLGDNNGGFDIEFDSSDAGCGDQQIYAVVWNGTTATRACPTGGATSLNAWHHIVATYDGTTLKVTVDGSASGSIAATMTTPTSYDFRIGANTDNSDYFKGNIDDVRVYNRVLSDTEKGELASGDNTSATWTGATSTAFSNGGNWDIGAIPDAYTNIDVPATANSVVLGATTGVANLNLQSGANFSLNGHDFTVNDSGEFVNNGTFQLAGNETLTNFVNDTGDTGTVWYNGSGTYGSLAAGNDYHGLKFSGSGSWTLPTSSTVTANSDLAIGSGVTFNASSSTINVAGNFQNSGTFNAGTSTVNFNGYQQQITGANSFYNLTDTNATGSSSLTFPAGKTQTVTNALNLQGSSGRNLALKSSTPGTQWKLDMQGNDSNINLNYLDISDSNNISAGNTALSATFSSGSNLTNWNVGAPQVSNFGPPAAVGTGYVDTATPTLTFKTADADSSQVKYEIKITNSSTTLVDYTSTYAAPGDASFTVGQAAGSGTYTTGSASTTLGDGTYYWQVKLTDNGGNSGLQTTYGSDAHAFIPGYKYDNTFVIDHTAPNVPASSLNASAYYDVSPQATDLTASDNGGGSGLQGIYYTTDGSTPSKTNGTRIDPNQQFYPYNRVTLTSGTTVVKAISYDNAGNASGVMSKTYIVDTVAPNTPTASPASGTYKTDQSVTLSATDNAGGSGIDHIYYTTDGSTPDSSSTQYTGAITVSSDQTIKAIAYDKVGHSGGILTISYVVDKTAPDAPAASPAGGAYNTSKSVTLTADDNDGGSGIDKIYYTTNGSTPSSSSTQYTGAITVSGNQTIKAIAYDKAGNASSVMSEAYTIDSTAPNDPTVDVAGGTYKIDKTVTLSATDNGGGTGIDKIYYTTNGSTPSSSNGTAISSGDTVTISSNETLRAIAYDKAGNVSGIFSADYVIDKAAPNDPTASPAGGLYTSDQSVTLSATDNGGGSGIDHIYYTLDGSAPTSSSTVYSGPITIAASKTLKAIAYDNAGNVSGVSSDEYVIDKTAPVATLRTTADAGQWTTHNQPTLNFATSEDGGLDVKYQIQISANSGFSSPVVDYTSDQSAAGDDSFTVGQAAGSGSYAEGSSGQKLDDGTYNWRVRAIDSLGLASDWAEAGSSKMLQIDTAAPGTPMANVAAGVYGSVQSVELSAYDSTTGSGIDHIYYTTDGSAPTSASTVYTGAISVGSSETIKAIAYDKAGNAGDVLSNEYTIDLSSPGTQLDGFASTNGWTSDTSPTLNFTTQVTGGGQVKYQIQIDDSTSFGTPVIDYTSDLASAGARSFTIGQAAGSGNYTTGSGVTTLADGNYDWRVRTITTTGLASAWVTADDENMTVGIDTTAPGNPSSSLSAGNYDGAQSTTLSASDNGGGSGIDHIYYTLDGSTPSKTHGTTYTGAISITKSETVKAISYDKAGNASGVASFSYTIDKTAPNTPTASVKGGSYNKPQTITLKVSDNSGGSGIDGIYYTVNGTVPSKTNGTKIASGGTVYVNTGTTLKAIAYDKAGNASAIMTEKYEIDVTPPSAPTASLPVNVYSKAQTVKLTATDNAGGSGIDAIYYTTDGSTPTKSHGIKYTGPIKVGNSQAIKAVAYDKAGNGSPFMTTAYIISSPSKTTGSTPTPTTNNVTVIQGSDASQTEAPKPKIVTKVVKVPVIKEVAKASPQTSGGDKKTGLRFFGLSWWWWIIFLIIALLCWLLPSPRRKNKEEARQLR